MSNECVVIEAPTGGEVEVDNSYVAEVKTYSGDFEVTRNMDVFVELNNWTLSNDSILIKTNSDDVPPELVDFLNSLILDQDLDNNTDFNSLKDFVMDLDESYTEFVSVTNTDLEEKATHISALQAGSAEQGALITEIDQAYVNSTEASAISVETVGTFFGGYNDANSWYTDVSYTNSSQTSANAVNIEKVSASLAGVESEVEQIMSATTELILNPDWTGCSNPDDPNDTECDDPQGHPKYIMNSKAEYSLSLAADLGDGYVTGIFAVNELNGGTRRDQFQIATNDFSVVSPDLIENPGGSPTPDDPLDDGYNPEKYLLRVTRQQNPESLEYKTSLMVTGSITSRDTFNNLAARMDSSDLSFYRGVPLNGDVLKAEKVKYLTQVSSASGPIRNGEQWIIPDYYEEPPIIIASVSNCLTYSPQDNDQQQRLEITFKDITSRTPGYWEIVPVVNLFIEGSVIKLNDGGTHQTVNARSNFTQASNSFILDTQSKDISMGWSISCHTGHDSCWHWDRAAYDFVVQQRADSSSAWTDVTGKVHWEHRVKSESFACSGTSGGKNSDSHSGPIRFATTAGVEFAAGTEFRCLGSAFKTAEDPYMTITIYGGFFIKYEISKSILDQSEDSMVSLVAIERVENQVN